MKRKILVIGSGSWGTALANTLAINSSEVLLQTRNSKILKEINESNTNYLYLPNIKLEKNLSAIDEIQSDVEAVYIATPSSAVPEVFEKINSHKFSKECIFVICSKGIVVDSLELLSQAFFRIVKNENLAILSGPNFAIEVAQKQPTQTTIACKSIDLFYKISKMLDTDFFKTKYSGAIEFCEISSLIKNIIAIGCGLLDALNYGVNAKTALVLTGINEIKQLSTALNIEQDFISPACFGDIFLTCSSAKSRNFAFGYNLGKKQNISSNTTFEGLNGIIAVVNFAKKLQLKLDLCQLLAKIINKELEVDEIKLAINKIILS